MRHEGIHRKLTVQYRSTCWIKKCTDFEDGKKSEDKYVIRKCVLNVNKHRIEINYGKHREQIEIFTQVPCNINIVIMIFVEYFFAFFVKIICLFIMNKYFRKE